MESVERQFIMTPPADNSKANQILSGINPANADTFPNLELVDDNGNVKKQACDYRLSEADRQKASELKGGKKGRELMDDFEADLPGSSIWTVGEHLSFDSTNKTASHVKEILEYKGLTIKQESV